MAYASGTNTLVTGTETTLGNINSPGEFYLIVELANMAAGDVTEIRSYQKVLPSGTARVADFAMLAGVQPTNNALYISSRYVNDLGEKDSVQFTLKQTFGTGRAYNWKIMQVGPPNFYNMLIAPTGSVTVGTNLDKNGYGINTGTFLDAASDVIWNDLTADHQIVGSMGKALTDAGSAGDPWGTALPGVYASGTAGNILGGRLDVLVSSRMPSGTSSGGDPWSTVLPGAYGAGTAGYIIGTNVDARISSRMASGTVVVATVNDKTGYSLLNNQVVNFSGTITNVVNVLNQVSVSGSVASVTAPVTVGTNNDKTGYSLSTPQSFTLIGNISGTHVGNQIGTVSAIQGGTVSVSGTVISSVVQGGVVTVSGTVTATVASVPLVGMVTGSVGSVVGLNTSLIDVAISSRMASGTVVVGTNNDKTNYSLANNQVVNFSGTITNVVNVINQVSVSGSVASVANPVTVGTNNDKTGYSLSSLQSFNMIGNISGTIQGNLNGYVGQVTGSVMSLISGSQASIDYSQVWSFTGTRSLNGNQNWNVSGTITNVVNVINQVTVSGSTSGGDPWNTAVPGAYAAGTAGYILGNNLDDKVSSRLSSGTFAGNYVTPPTAAANASAVLAAATANPIDANIQEVNDVVLKGDGSTTPWGPV